MPLVCRAWRDAAQAPSVMWECLRLSLTMLEPEQMRGSEVAGEVFRPAALAPWLAARSRSIHSLVICILDDAAAAHMTEGCEAILKAAFILHASVHYQCALHAQLAASETQNACVSMVMWCSESLPCL